MDFEKAIKHLFEEAVNCFNAGEYDRMRDITVENLELISPEIKSHNFFSPAVHIRNRQEVFAYWKAINQQHDNRITSYKYIKTGKNLLVRCFYDHLKLIIDCEIKIDEYARTTKIVNHLVSIED